MCAWPVTVNLIHETGLKYDYETELTRARGSVGASSSGPSGSASGYETLTQLAQRPYVLHLVLRLRDQQPLCKEDPCRKH